VAARFVRLYPNVTMEWEVNENQPSLNSSVYDLWIKVGDIDNDQLVVRKIGYAQRALISAPHLGKVEHPCDLESKPAIRISTALPKSVELRHSSGEKFNLMRRCVFTTDSLYAAREAVREGLGYAVLPLWSVRAELECGTLVHTCEAWTPPPILLSFSFLPDGKRPARVTALLEYLRSEFRRRDGAGVEFFDNFRRGHSGAADELSLLQ
jgi:DNA-binding transcriptional LysR family regulator